MTVKQFIVCMCGLFAHSKHTWKKTKQKRKSLYICVQGLCYAFFSQEYSPKPWKELTETVFLL